VYQVKCASEFVIFVPIDNACRMVASSNGWERFYINSTFNDSYLLTFAEHNMNISGRTAV
jgi:hypothetical protein